MQMIQRRCRDPQNTEQGPFAYVGADAGRRASTQRGSSENVSTSKQLSLTTLGRTFCLPLIPVSRRPCNPIARFRHQTASLLWCGWNNPEEPGCCAKTPGPKLT